MTVLRLLLDPTLGPVTTSGRYAMRLARALIAARPEGSLVSGVISSTSDDDVAAIESDLPALDQLHQVRLKRRELRAAWQHGITVIPGSGLVHATDLFAPLGRHDRTRTPDSQTVVTLHDTRPWTAAESMDPRAAARLRAMGRRAERYADAIIVPSHAVAYAAGEVLDIADRVRVVAAAPHPGVRNAVTETDIRFAGEYVIAVAPDDGLPDLAEARLAAALPRSVGLVTVGPSRPGAELTAADPSVTRLLDVPDVRLGEVIAGARALVHLDPDVGLGIPILDAMSRGTPVIHRGSDASRELIADGGIEAEDEERAAAAVVALIEDPAFAERTRVLGSDRAGAFTWRDTAEKLWQLHADL